MSESSKKTRGRPKMTEQQKAVKKHTFSGTPLIAHIEEIKDTLQKERDVQIVTYQFPHNEDMVSIFEAARHVAEYAVKNKKRKGKLSSAEVSQYGLPSAISNQIMRKYSGSTIKKVKNVVIVVPGQSVSYSNDQLRIPCLKISRKFCTGRQILKVNQIELNKTTMFITVTIDTRRERYTPSTAIGVDLNCTHHVLVAADIETGKVYKFGKQIPNVRKKYFKKRRRAQKESTVQVKVMGNREQRITKDLDNKISKKIVEIAKQNKASLYLENLTNIRNRVSKQHKNCKNSNRFVNSWSFYRLQNMIRYKAKLLGVPCFFVCPAYTSQMCSRCSHIGMRSRKTFKCEKCGHKDHADSNAAFNIAKRGIIDRDTPINPFIGLGRSRTQQTEMLRQGGLALPSVILPFQVREAEALLEPQGNPRL